MSAEGTPAVVNPQEDLGNNLREGAESIDVLARALADGRAGVRLLVPTATLAEHRRHQLARFGLVVPPDAVVTFSRFAANLAPDLEQVSEPLFHLLVKRAVQELAPPEFRAVSDAPGFAGSVADSILRLDAAGLSARHLRQVCGAGWPYAAPLAAIWDRAEVRLRERGLSLRSGVLRAAAAQGRYAGTVLLDGFAKFSRLERELFERLNVDAVTEATTARSTVPVSRFAADTEVREAEEIARRILLASAAGTSFREIGIALRTPERSLGVLRPVLERFGIPARFYFPESLQANAVARFLSGTVDAYLSGWDHERCLPVIRLAAQQETGALDAFDFAVREQIPNAGLDALRALAPRVAQGLLLDWARLDRKWGRKREAQSWAESLGADLRSLFRPGPIADGLPAGTVEWQRACAAALPLFEAALLEAALAWPGGQALVSLAEFWGSAKTVLEQTALRVVDRRRNVVHVVSLYEARQWELHTLFLCGMVERAFPRKHQEDPFLPDEAMQALQRAGFSVETSADRNREEETLFHRACRSARVALVFSYAADQKNEPSRFWTEAPGGAEQVIAVKPAVRHREPARRLVSRIHDPGLVQWIGSRHQAFSVTGLENYLACPFRFFATKTLSLKPPPLRPEDRLNFLEQGNIVHAVLEQWLPERTAIGPIFDTVFREKCAALRVKLGYRSELAYARMLADLERFAAVAAPIWPQHEACPPEETVTFEAAEGITVKARIDRMERLPDGSLVIVDYKYSNAANTRQRAEDDTRLQGPLYVRGIEQRGEVVAAMVYFSLKQKPEPFGWGVVPGLSKHLQPLTREWVAEGTRRAQAAVEEIRTGRIAVSPASADACKWCEAQDACRVEAEAGVAAAG